MRPSPDVTATRAGGRHGTPWRAAGTAVVVLLAMVGAGLIGASLKTAPAPRPPQPAAQAGAAADPPPVVATNPTAAVPALPRSAPTTVTIARIGVHAQVMSLGTNPDGTVEVPPLEQAHLAGWYSPGASPGEAGNAVIVGHVDSAATGPAVFFSLGALRRGDTVGVTREDGRQLTFQVDDVRSYPKAAFPTELVYGPSDRPGLRVVTCGGVFDEATRDYPDNVVVFASLVG
ncbi:Sortase family protein [Micromonospora nigra]|uniref:Sortase family protein n=1 Tax=Micromonospora nigra TaxID=145857 RepID=A0A1C6RMM1_9ACTN|nr:class F sortase [Micromonospora nigra]SCL18424.1 Sortase family protein [Micromonospora nigra]